LSTLIHCISPLFEPSGHISAAHSVQDLADSPLAIKET
jgi:hypothetical protein